MITVWPALPTIVDELPLYERDRWPYPGVNLHGGDTHLRAWSRFDGGRWLVVVSERGEGCSVTNAAHHIVERLRDTFGADVVVLEHYPAEQRGDGATLDQVAVDDGEVRRIAWRRIFPGVLADRADAAELHEWIHHRGGAHVLRALDLDPGPPDVHGSGGPEVRTSGSTEVRK